LLPDDPTQALTFIKLLPEKKWFQGSDDEKVAFSTRYDQLADRLVEIDDASKRAAKDATDPLAADVLGLTGEAMTSSPPSTSKTWESSSHGRTWSR